MLVAQRNTRRKRAREQLPAVPTERIGIAGETAGGNLNEGQAGSCREQVVGSEQDGVAMIFCKYELIPGGFNVVAKPSGLSMSTVGKPRGKMAPSSEVEASVSPGLDKALFALDQR